MKNIYILIICMPTNSKIKLKHSIECINYVIIKSNVTVNNIESTFFYFTVLLCENNIFVVFMVNIVIIVMLFYFCFSRWFYTTKKIHFRDLRNFNCYSYCFVKNYEVVFSIYCAQRHKSHVYF